MSVREMMDESSRERSWWLKVVALLSWWLKVLVLGSWWLKVVALGICFAESSG